MNDTDSHRGPNNASSTGNTMQQVFLQIEKEEILLLRECLYALQGINGEVIQFVDAVAVGPPLYSSTHAFLDSNGPAALIHTNVIVKEEEVAIHPLGIFSIQHPDIVARSRLGSGAMDALKICSEAGWLYRKIRSYTDQIQQHQSYSSSLPNNNSTSTTGTTSTSIGVVSRALAATLSYEMRNYHSLLANMEAGLMTMQQPHSPHQELTLRQLLVDLHNPTVRLHTLAMITDGVSSRQGGQLLTALHKHTLHGDTRHSTLLHTIVYEASQPWFDILYLWTQKGILQDAHGEFFIGQHHPKNGSRASDDDKYNDMLWSNRYFIKTDQIPCGILDPDLVRPILIVGKGINFIRKCLCDDEWTLQVHVGTVAAMDANGAAVHQHNNDPAQLKKQLGYHYNPIGLRHPHETRYTSPLHQTLAQTARQVHSHILKSLREDHHLIQHLWALKQFLFLGQGDFISALMDTLAAEFDGRTGITGIYKHTLMGILEGALRSTNAAALPAYTLKRLQVELLLKEEDEDARYRFGPDRFETNNGNKSGSRTGWDIFTLTYDVSAPLTAIVHPEAMQKYRLVFSLLFRLKHVEYMLNSTWRQSTALQHALITSAQYNGIHMNDNVGYAYATVFLRKISMTRQSMLHFVGNLQSYLMLEVFEGGWKGLVQRIDAAKTLDEVIDAHDNYLRDILQKCLMRGSAGSSSRSHQQLENQLSIQIENLLDTARIFCTKQDVIFSDSLRAVERAEEKRKEAERRMKEGHWGFDTERGVVEEETFFGLIDESLGEEVVAFSERFQGQMQELLKGLNEKLDGSGVALPVLTPGRPLREAPGKEFDDSLRFLVFQLDYNSYYSKTYKKHKK